MINQKSVFKTLEKTTDNEWELPQTEMFCSFGKEYGRRNRIAIDGRSKKCTRGKV